MANRRGSASASASGSTVRRSQDRRSDVLASRTVCLSERHHRPQRIACQEKICHFSTGFNKDKSRENNVWKPSTFKKQVHSLVCLLVDSHRTLLPIAALHYRTVFSLTMQWSLKR